MNNNIRYLPTTQTRSMSIYTRYHSYLRLPARPSPSHLPLRLETIVKKIRKKLAPINASTSTSTNTGIAAAAAAVLQAQCRTTMTTITIRQQPNKANDIRFAFGFIHPINNNNALIDRGKERKKGVTVIVQHVFQCQACPISRELNR